MPLLDIATSQPYFRNHICASRAQIFINGSTLRKINFIKEEKLSSTWKLSTPRKVTFNVGHPNRRNALLITAVSTLEQKHITQNENGSNDGRKFLFDPDSNSKMFNSSSESSSEIDEKEKLRRMRISNANKGNVPWNKGRKHSAETLQRIRERTRLAMQDPKVKMKLVNLGHAQSEETRMKIGVGVRMGWKRRRAKLLVQETCCFEWQNLIAEASRKGYHGEEELQWDSYKILDKQLQQEWLESIEQRKSMPRAKGNKRAPKSPEQRRKISEAISAKWNDPEYRERVCSALEKYHGTPVGTQKRRPRRNPSENSESPRSRVKRKVNDDSGHERKSQARSRPKRSPPKYKDPLADSKLEMIKNIRAQRMAMETKKIEAMERARLLITEAEKAAKTLEEAALTNPLARASLLETRKLIAEATRSIEAVETGHITSYEKDSYSSSKFNGQVNCFVEETDSGNGNDTPPNMKEPNGIHVLFLQNNGVEDLNLGKTSVQDLINHEYHEQTRNDRNSSSLFQSNVLINQISVEDQQISQFEANGAVRNERAEVPNNGEKTVLLLNGAGQTLGTTNPTKKWVCGRLVEVSDSTSENGKTLGQE
ncbi:muscle M-line assembly protein [Thalictrum thalictroides]|uniref:Muscle M-line assembly protein n=1 Tax=Thalictrum thalictroides TaxID=46969 RepID=A0A7J6WRF8_THATH|nr:muscle M-line assembly protein [Thalictrum thalictroides]